MKNPEYILQYQRRVWDFLEKLEPNIWLKVNRQCKPENKELFISSIKLYMDSFPYQGFISFNKDYTEFYKTHPCTNKYPTTKIVTKHSKI